jgi:dephospho-CoA kinase
VIRGKKHFMKTIGLIGGIASGKSAVSAALARRGAQVFDADKIGHKLLDDPEVRDELVGRWGSEILDDSAKVDRKQIAARVFQNTDESAAELTWLEQLLHPRIRQHIQREIARLPDEGPPAIVIDAPLLLESGWNEACQVIALVDCPREQRLARAQERGWTPEEFTRRELAQVPIEEKRRWATHVIDNSATLADLDAQVEQFWTSAVVDQESDKAKRI